MKGGCVQEVEGPLRCNPSFQKQHDATKKYINPNLTEPDIALGMVQPKPDMSWNM